MEVRPSLVGRRVTHHAVVYLQQEEEPGDFEPVVDVPGRGSYLTEFAVGKIGDVFRENTGKLLKAGSRITFDNHYHSVGEEITTQTDLGVWFHPQGYVPKYRVYANALGVQQAMSTLDIPPGKVTTHHAYVPLRLPARLENYQPHMHIRGKAMSMEAIYPNGRVEMLSHVANFDFNWHVNYVYTDDSAPVLPAGTVIHLTAWHDNTAGNRANPGSDPVGGLGAAQLRRHVSRPREHDVSDRRGLPADHRRPASATNQRLISVGDACAPVSPSPSGCAEPTTRCRRRRGAGVRAPLPGCIVETPLTPLEFQRRTRALYPDRECVVDGSTRLTYEQFFARCDRWSAALQRLGVRKGDRVAYISLNTSTHLESFYAVPQIGAVLVPINFRLQPQEIAYIVQHSGATVVCAHADFLETVEAIRGSCSAVEHYVALEGAHEGWHDYEALLGAETNAPDRPEIDERDLLTINYTSGTTSRPKGVMITHRNAYMNAVGTLVHLPMTCADRYLWTLPMFHANGWTFVWIVTAVGGTHVCLRKVDPVQAFRLIRDERATMLCAAPTVLIGLASCPADQRGEIPPGLRVLTAGAPPAAATIQRVEGEFGWELTHVYGLTETAPFITVCEPRPEHAALSPRGPVRRQGAPGCGADHVGRAAGSLTRRTTRCRATPRHWARSSCGATSSWKGITTIPMPRRRRCAAAGSTAATRRWCTRTGIARSATGSRTSSSAAARTSPRSRSKGS